MFVCERCKKSGLDANAMVAQPLCRPCFNHIRSYKDAPEPAPETGGLRCPKCEGDTIDVWAVGKRELIGNGTVRRWAGRGEWNGGSPAECCGCSHQATVADFRVKSVRQMLLEVAELCIEYEDWPGLKPLWSEIYNAAKTALAAVEKWGLDG